MHDTLHRSASALCTVLFATAVTLVFSVLGRLVLIAGLLISATAGGTSNLQVPLPTCPTDHNHLEQSIG